MSLRRAIEYVFSADTSPLTRGMQPGINSMERMAESASDLERDLRTIPNNIDIDIDLKRDTISLLRTKLRGQLNDLNQSIKIDPDVDATAALAQIRKIERELRRLDRMDVDVNIDADVDRGLYGLQRFTEVSQEFIQTGPRLLRLLAGPQGIPAGMYAFGVAAQAATAGVGAFGLGLGALVAGKTLESMATFEQEQAKINAVLGDQEQIVRDWADTLSTRVGVGTNELTKTATAVADLLVPQGYTRAKAAELATSLTEIGGALAQSDARPLEESIQAVTGALLGEREMLKGFGVAISQAQVDARKDLLKTQESFKGLNDEQLTTEATLQLIKEKSADAMSTFEDGAGRATDAWKTLTATLDNLKFEAFTGFGQIIADVVLDIGQLSGVGDDLVAGPEALRKWIAENRLEIRGFFLDLAEVALQFGTSTLEAVESVIPALASIADAAAGVIGALAGYQSFQASQEANAKRFDAAVARSRGDDSLARQLEAEAAALDAQADKWDRAGEAIDGVGDTLRGVEVDLSSAKDKLQELALSTQQLRGLNDIQIRVKADGLDAVRADVGRLSGEELLALQVQIPDDTKNKALRELENLARRREAEITAKNLGVELSEKQLKELSRDRDANIKAQVKNLTQAQRQLDNAARTRNAQIRVSAGGDGTTVIRNRRGQLVPVVGGRIIDP